MKCYECKYCKKSKAKDFQRRCKKNGRGIIMDGLSGCSEGEYKDRKKV